MSSDAPPMYNISFLDDVSKGRSQSSGVMTSPQLVVTIYFDCHQLLLNTPETVY